MSLTHAIQDKGILIADDVELPTDITIGANVVIGSGVKIGRGCVIGDGAILGKQPKLADHSSAKGSSLPQLVVEDNVVIGCQAIVFAGVAIGTKAIVGDQAFIRERSRLGAHTVVGRGSVVDNDVSLGERVRVQTNVYLTACSIIEDDVFIGPGVCTTNDSTMARHGQDFELQGAVLRRACRVGGGVVICPGIEIGPEAYVAAGAVVTRDVQARAVMMGVPARQVREVPEEDLLDRWR